MEWRYQIMHREQVVAVIDSNGQCSIAVPSFLPYNLVLEEDTNLSPRVNNLGNFYYWCASRVFSLDRVYAKEILNAIGVGHGTTDRDRAKISLSYHCVTLTDVYWVRRAEESISYADVNLYEHSQSDAFVDVSLLGKEITAANAELLKPLDVAGDVSTQGVVPKAWVRRDGQLWLLKNGGQRDVDAELLASKIARCFDVPQVLYEPYVYNGVPVSASRLVSSLSRSLIPMEFVDIYAANHDTTRQVMIAQIDPCGFHRMNIIDYLVGNTDRHWGNWGFEVDNETNRPMRLYPLMDFNKAFLAYDALAGGRCLTTERNMTQMDAAMLGAERVGLGQIADIQRDWFADEATWDMFCRRLEKVRAAADNT